MGGSNQKSTVVSDRGSLEPKLNQAHNKDQSQIKLPNIPDFAINKILYKGTSLSLSEIHKISEILIQKCKDTIRDSDTFM